MIRQDTWPGELPGKNRAAPYINRLRKAAMASGLKGVIFAGGGVAKVVNEPDGKTIVLTANTPKKFGWQTIVPFSIYQFANNGQIAIYSTGTGYSVNDILTVSGGTGTAQTLTVTSVGTNGEVFSAQTLTAGNYTVAPTYPANVSGGSGSGCQIVQPSAVDNWRTFQMRDGIIGWRPRHPNFFVPGGIPNGTLNHNGTVGNSEWLLSVYNDYFSNESQSNSDSGQPVTSGSSAGSRVIPINTSVQIFGFDSGGATIQWGQIILDNAWNGADEAYKRINLFIWVEIIDSATLGLYANLWARMQMIDGGDQTTQFYFPTGKNIIPIGIVLPSFKFPSGQIGGGPAPLFVAGYLSGYDDTTQYIPYQIGNLINRHQDSPSVANQNVEDGYLTSGFGTNFIGYWNYDNLSGQLFYPGDMIIDDSAIVPISDDPPTISISSYNVYVYRFVATSPYPGFSVETDPPATSSYPERWQIVGTVFQLP